MAVDGPGTPEEDLVAMQSDTAVSAADREAAAARLREQYSAGRLTLDEFQERLDAVYLAQTSRDLDQVMTDLPLEGVVYGPGGRPGGTWQVPPTCAPPWPRRAGGSRSPLAC